MSTVLKQVDPATGVTELGYNRYIIDKVVEKLYRTFEQIENKLKLKIEFQLVFTEHGHLSVNGVNNHVISSDSWITSKGIKEVHFNCYGFPLTFRDAHRSKLSISFTKYFDVEFVNFTGMSKKISHYEKIDVKFDKNIELQSISFNTEFPKTNNDVLKSRKNNTLLSFDNEVVLWRLFLNKSDDIKELIPEYYIPSAYNFKSEEFINRLQVFSMLTL